MSAAHHLFLLDMLRTGKKVIRQATDPSFEGFAEDARTLDALLHNLAMIEEAANCDYIHAYLPDPSR